MNEWDYKKHRTPTKARGLFTRETGGTGNKYEIVIRGYDKFFNVGEVPETEWKDIVTHTKGPYEVTVKENGCIIFISGLPGGFIIVTSKHSMGEREDGLAHAVVGEQWLDKHLKKVGKSKQELAKFLYENRLTAVAELCDDQFEEHVLSYTHDRRGLYLHGINFNTADLKSYPSKMVADFAKEWGFKPTKYYIKQTAEEVKTFTDDIKQKGLLDDRPIEGFVIRTKTVSTGQDFFFKIKYDEPYLMYREWREITKALLSKKKPKTTYALSKRYVEWVTEKIQTQPKLFEEFKKNHGIFHVRELFLEYLKKKGDVQTVAKIPQEEIKTLLIPVATIGCGKTTLSLALAKLFSFGHIQNDNIVGKKARVEFYRKINEELESRNVVIADRNNHMRELRKTLIESVKTKFSNIRIVAIYWNHEDLTNNEIFTITSNRVVSRGDNHQSLTPKNPDYELVMWRFLKDFQHLNSNNNVDDQFDRVIELDIANDIETNLNIVINELKSIIGIENPSKDAIEKVLEEINSYKPTVRKIVKNRKATVSYYGIGLDFDAQDFLTKFYDEHPNEESSTFKRLVQGKRIIPAHHITLVHSKELEINPPNEKKELWKQYEELCKDSPQVKVYIDKIVFDSQIMALVVNRIDPSNIRSTNKIMHVTVGTVDDSIKYFQANKLCELALSEEGNQSEVRVINLKEEWEVNGTLKAYLTRTAK
ncbi:RNA ligase-domain-containing protein [Glomus cerebriforme]|uniref:RNA ligase-domain-containing protein n=1 Tax=Glomus cerebriforme TaxID=658196 RepID=A0A397SYE4_9GLOM|nr:RNA ligase-domain-containing protein [Glomus cerebriforme]